MGKSITAIVLTKNEELHIRRCVENLKQVCSLIYVVDSFSTDRTCSIAQECGATVIQHEYLNQAQQFQWALENCTVETEWTIRLDADEYLTDGLITEIEDQLDSFKPEVTGVKLPRSVRFLNHTLRFGSLRPVKLLRLWRTGKAYMEQRWMDEQMVLSEGKDVTFKHRFIDENLNGLTDWTQKHNNYSNREILVELDKRYGLFEKGEDATLSGRNRQKSLYYRLPRFFRASLYFFARYICCLGFLDGKAGLIWHRLQAYWYRFLVDAKLLEMETRLGKNPSKEQVIEYVNMYYGIKIDTK